MAELYGSFRKGNIYAAYALWGIDSLNENIANMFYEDYVNAQTLGRQNIINALIHSGKLTDKTINIIMLGFKVGLVPQTYLTINSEKFMPAILQVLNGNDTTDKLIFIKLLKSMEPEKAAKAVPVILPMLRDKNEYIVLSSAEFLERYDIPEAKAIVQKHHEAFNKD